MLSLARPRPSMLIFILGSKAQVSAHSLLVNWRRTFFLFASWCGDSLWNDNPHKKCHKDIDARWTKKVLCFAELAL